MKYPAPKTYKRSTAVQGKGIAKGGMRSKANDVPRKSAGKAAMAPTGARRGQGMHVKGGGGKANSSISGNPGTKSMSQGQSRVRRGKNSLISGQQAFRG